MHCRASSTAHHAHPKQHAHFFNSLGNSVGNIRCNASACPNVLRIAVMSRGPPRSSAKRDKARSKSCTLRSPSRKSAAKRAFSTKNAMLSCRSEITESAQDGLDKRRSNNRAPPAVTVRSIADKSDPARPPSVPRVNSKDRRVAASICIVVAWPSITGGRTSGRFPFCVISIYSATSRHCRNLRAVKRAKGIQ